MHLPLLFKVLRRVSFKIESNQIRITNVGSSARGTVFRAVREIMTYD